MKTYRGYIVRQRQDGMIEVVSQLHDDVVHEVECDHKATDTELTSAVLKHLEIVKAQVNRC